MWLAFFFFSNWCVIHLEWLWFDEDSKGRMKKKDGLWDISPSLIGQRQKKKKKKLEMRTRKQQVERKSCNFIQAVERDVWCLSRLSCSPCPSFLSVQAVDLTWRTATLPYASMISSQNTIRNMGHSYSPWEPTVSSPERWPCWRSWLTCFRTRGPTAFFLSTISTGYTGQCWLVCILLKSLY